ncbi:hypothetical protein Anas_10259 [Armadillidium nasatum]|uniref:Uncharacterized protein n=1 Tax=Armadillidium nasatum TaxID=96803 RepID=A0A5N5TGV2_9CRUS|nr:hypothetical protein Anas_10259 [Armadillidium nasatum]
MWRFAPLGDDQVDILLSRDLDSEILKREYDAVSEWLNSTNKSLHIMRDHPQHCVQMLGGTWGIKIENGLKKRRIRTLCRYNAHIIFDNDALQQTHTLVYGMTLKQKSNQLYGEAQLLLNQRMNTLSRSTSNPYSLIVFESFRIIYKSWPDN